MSRDAGAAALVGLLETLMDDEPPLRVGERVELLPGAPVPRGSGLKPGAHGRVVVTDIGRDQ
jgi:hypothetical protein